MRISLSPHSFSNICDYVRGRESEVKNSHRRGREEKEVMATLVTTPSSLTNLKRLHVQGKAKFRLLPPQNRKLREFMVRAAKLPSGVEIPKIEPKLTEPFLGFTNTAEIWNSRACMIGIVGTFLVELIFHRGILQLIGVDVGKGLNLPL
ncbi:light-harvesting complex-like protein OHP1, chloroplastic [Phalaenopsis equestris]|uniref:light-harvesting complex-like protein OHP1, chloroplastic n=1 Tax=Phalaenopsis equestris TaxID=78828 RepID=UPI0009E4E53E|nr:light-harvesting complex-like protein OHP1, chloroplastic [Phalaenopsis equestris]